MNKRQRRVKRERRRPGLGCRARNRDPTNSFFKKKNSPSLYGWMWMVRARGVSVSVIGILVGWFRAGGREKSAGRRSGSGGGQTSWGPPPPLLLLLVPVKNILGRSRRVDPPGGGRKQPHAPRNRAGALPRVPCAARRDDDGRGAVLPRALIGPARSLQHPTATIPATGEAMKLNYYRGCVSAWCTRRNCAMGPTPPFRGGSLVAWWWCILHPSRQLLVDLFWYGITKIRVTVYVQNF